MTFDQRLTKGNQKKLTDTRTYANFNRTKTLAGILILADLVFISIDYLNKINGRWTLGYRALFQAHLVLGIVSVLAFITAVSLKPKSNSGLKGYYGVFATAYAWFILLIAAVVSGWIDQHIHGEITIYIMACFAIAVIYYQSPKLSVLQYVSSYVLFAVLLANGQPDPAIRQGHYFNALLLVVVAFFVSTAMHKLMQRDSLYQNSLEELVDERTCDLQRYNDLLKQEIMERQRAEFELDRFFVASPDILCILDFTGKVKRTNPAFQQILGYEPDELEMSLINPLIHPEDLPVAKARIEAALQHRQSILIVELRCRSKTGEYKWLEWLAALEPDSESIFAVGRDVTSRKQAIAKVSRLASIVESANDGIIGMDLIGNIVDYNSSARRILGLQGQELRGRHLSQLLAAEEYAELEVIWQKVAAGEQVSLFETTWHHQDGSAIDVALNIFPIGNVREGFQGYSLIMIELTEKKQMESELARLDRLNIVGEMAACICHEVRNPMTTIKGFLQFTRDKQDAKGREYFDIMIEELDRANAILSEFLSISRTKVTIFEPCNINELIKALWPLIQAEALANDKWVEVDLHDVPKLNLEQMEIRQLVLNLVRNGLEAMEPGGTLKISTCFRDGEVILGVADEGSGIEPEVLAKLGTPFFSTKKDGTGLGLAVCESIITRHKGRMEVESGTGGSTFSVFFNPATTKQGVA